MKRFRQRRASAFTLVEVLIAIGLLGIVVAAIYSSWTAILRASKAAQNASAAAQRERMAVQVIEDALNGTCMFAANGRWYAFVAENGEDAVLSFVAHLPKSFPRSGKFGDLDVRRVTFTLEPGSDFQKQLVLRQNPLLMEVDKDEEAKPLVLARYVKELQFSFWDARQGDWVDEWNNTNQIPKIVMISLIVNQAGSYGAGRESQQQMVRIVNLPAGGLQGAWQVPNLPPPGSTGPGGNPPPTGPGGNQPGQQPIPRPSFGPGFRR
jgi:prepilin-type N-terminal cleavage/methylation domain-containing protein